MNSPTNYLTGLLCVAVLGAGALLWRQHSVVDDLRTELLAASEAQTRREARHVAEQAEFARHAQEMDQRVHQLETQLADAKRAAAAATPTKPFLTVAGDAGTSRAQAARVRPKMVRQYSALAKKLGLNPAQTDQFMTLLVDKELASADAIAAAMQAGDKRLNDPIAVAILEAAARNDVEAQIQALLGDAGYEQYLEAVRVAGQTNTLGRLQAALMDTEPLSDAQLGQLQQVLDDNHINHISDKVVADVQAQGFLTPAQMKALQNLYQEQQAGQARRRAP